MAAVDREQLNFSYFSYTAVDMIDMVCQKLMRIFYSNLFFSSVKWERDGNTVEWDNSIDGALRVLRVEPSHAGAYTCAVMGPHGEIARRELQLVVSSKFNNLLLISELFDN